MQEDQAETITQLPESILPHGKPSAVHHSENKSDLLSSHSSSIFSTFEPFWQIYCTLSIHNNPAPTTTTHRSCYRRNNNPGWSFSSSICCRLSTDFLAFNYKLLKWNESTTEFLSLLEGLQSTFDRDKEIHQYFFKLFTQHVCRQHDRHLSFSIIKMRGATSQIQRFVKATTVYAHSNILSGVLARRQKKTV